MKNLTRNQKIIFGAIGGIIALCVVCFVVSFIVTLVNAGLQNAGIVEPTETPIPATEEPEPTPLPPTATPETIADVEPTETAIPPTEEIEPTAIPETASNLTGDVVLELSVNNVDTGRPTLTGQTNLPDGTSLLTSITNEEFGFTGQSDVEVINGSFEVGPFGPEDGLLPGVYIASVIMPIPSTQSDNVRAIIGENGENLTGNLVKQGELGVTVSTDVTFQVGTTNEADANQETFETEAATIYQELQQLLNTGYEMEAYRGVGVDTNIIAEQCMPKLRENQTIVEDLQNRADSLPQSYLLLKVATTEIQQCVTCSEFAIENCDIAASTLEELKSEFE